MTHQAPPVPATTADPGRQVAQLREALQLVDRIAGRDNQAPDSALDEAARVSSVYDRALPIVQRRFDALAGETATWVAAGVEALIAAGEHAPRAAALRLAQAIEASLRELAELLD